MMLLDRLYVDLKDTSGLGAEARTISPIVEVKQVSLPPLSRTTLDEWFDVIQNANPIVEIGDICGSSISAPRDFAIALDVAEMSAGLPVPNAANRNTRLFLTEGAAFHQDATTYDYYRNVAFTVLWLEDTDWDLVFPLVGKRIPLIAGTHILFDSGNPHGVVKRGMNHFDPEHFRSDENGHGRCFFSTEHPYNVPEVKSKMGIHFDTIQTFTSSGRHDLDIASRRYLDERSGAMTLPTPSAPNTGRRNRIY